MSETSTDDSGELKTSSSQTSEKLEQNVQDVIDKLNTVTNCATDKLESPWKHWSFLYRTMFILGIVLILVLSCILPIIVLQQAKSNGEQDTHVRALITLSTRDDQHIIHNQSVIITNEQQIIKDNTYREAVVVATCVVTPGCNLPPKP